MPLNYHVGPDMSGPEVNFCERCGVQLLDSNGVCPFCFPRKFTHCPVDRKENGLKRKIKALAPVWVPILLSLAYVLAVGLESRYKTRMLFQLWPIFPLLPPIVGYFVFILTSSWPPLLKGLALLVYFPAVALVSLYIMAAGFDFSRAFGLPIPNS